MQGEPIAAGEPSDDKFGVLLACFRGRKTAGKARRSLEARLKAQGDDHLDTVVVTIDEKHKASTHDARRVLWGTLGAAFVWGLCGLAGADGIASILLWAAIGGIGGAAFYYYVIRHLTKPELARIGTRLPPDSSALLLRAGTRDARRLLAAAAVQGPSVATVAAIDTDLTTRVFADRAYPIESPPGSAEEADEAAILNMVMLRYPSSETAKQIASDPPTGDKGGALDVEMVISTSADGHSHVSDPQLGVKGAARSVVRSWSGFGLVFGALVGAIGGGGVLGSIEGGLATAVAWGALGLAAGALYGLVAGAAFTPGRLKTIRPLSTPGTSILMAWTEKPITEDLLDPFMKPGSQRLVLNVTSREGGAVLSAT